MKIGKSLLILILSLLLFGLIIISNSTVVSSNNLYGFPYRFALLQLSWIVLGMIGFWIFYHFDYHKLEKASLPLFIISTTFLLTLGIVGILSCDISPSFSPCINGANRWLYLNPSPLPKIPFLGVLGFQPAEFTKLSLILFLSFGINKYINSKKNPFWFYLISTGICSFLVLLQPNMSTAAMLFLIGTSMYFSSGVSLKEFFIAIPITMISLLLAIFISPYRRARFLTLLGGDASSDLSSGYHIKQVLLSLGSGGILGVGFGQSKQKFYYLPEVASDSIFAVIGEEFGFIGTTAVVIAFAFLVFLGLRVAKSAKDTSGKLISVGVTSWIGFQFFINVAAMTKIIPLTGVPIPLISYGGSSILFLLVSLGILCNIEKQNRE